MATILFPLGVRLSTWIVLLVFLAFGVRDRRYWWAGAVWICGFETAYQLTNTLHMLAHKGFHPTSWWEPIVVFGIIAIGCGFVVAVAIDKGVRPSLPIMGVVVFLWVVWVATGFHVNLHTMTDFDPTTEALNEAVKTLWALAYLVPLRPLSRLRPSLELR